MMFYGKTVTLPPGIAAVAHRCEIDGVPYILRLLSQDVVDELTTQGRHAEIRRLSDQAVNALNKDFGDGDSITIDAATPLAS